MKHFFPILILVLLGPRSEAQLPTVFHPAPFSNTVAFGSQKRLQVVLFRTTQWVQDPVTESRGQWHIRETLKLGAPASVAFLRSPTFRSWFRPGELITTDLVVSTTEPERTIVQYWWDQGRNPPFGGGWPFSQEVQADIAPRETDIVVGFRLGTGSSARVGWLRYQRAPLDVVYQAWEPIAIALNPFPGRSIVAGAAPELPKLSFELGIGDFGHPTVRISWPAGFEGVEMQRTTRPDSTAIWNPFGLVPGTRNFIYYPKTGEDLQFFRLVYDY